MYDRVAFVNRDRMQRYLVSGIVKPGQAVLVGYPKLDPLVTDPPEAGMLRRCLGLIAGRSTIMYAPTWSYVSSLHVAGESIIETLLSMGCNVIAKLHDNCYERGERFAAGVDWRKRLKTFDGTAGFHLARSADSVLYMAAADVVVTDHSSIGFEALAVDRPVIVFDAPDLPRIARINPEKIALLRSASDVVYTVGELRDTVAGVLENRGKRAGDRRRVAAEMFHDPGRATARALDVIYGLLDLPAVHTAAATRLAMPALNRQPSIDDGADPQSAVRAGVSPPRVISNQQF
jgi:CDP-glycerol glycerophosphotransferase (TagB/SpsB family)